MRPDELDREFRKEYKARTCNNCHTTYRFDPPPVCLGCGAETQPEPRLLRPQPMMPFLVSLQEHNETGYRYGCRCYDCVEAQRDRVQSYRDRKQRIMPQNGAVEATETRDALAHIRSRLETFVALGAF